ncbi:uncharacterized protein [Lolium perenne]|uniref:uncharacterized protein n=1 Tax=Lolium perenne TaxID=4522 RepID=UPI0021F58428|nr:protease Do-like 1, chloroplastic [Lolium perenne]
MPHGEDASGSGSGPGSTATKRRRRAGVPPPALPPAVPTTGTSSDRSKPRRKRSKKPRRGDEQDERDAKRRNLGEEEEEEEEEVVSSAPSSPICEPYIPDDEEYSVELYEAFDDAEKYFKEKIGRQMQRSTLQNFMPATCLASDPKLVAVRERGTKAVVSAAKLLVGLSSSIDGKPLLRCSGFWVDWDKENKTGIVLTTAQLIRLDPVEYNVWLGKDEYDRNAKVIVHLLDETPAEGHLIYYQKHYDIALFRVRVDADVQLPLLNVKVQQAQEVFHLGRDGNLDLRVTHGRVEYLNPDVFQRYHFMFFSRSDVNEYDNGGVVIDLKGKVVGMVNISAYGSFIPSSILIKCLDLWKKLGRIPRPHLGFKFFAIKLLDPLYIDKIVREHKIDDGLIVNEVANGSNAERLGIQRGDIISCFNGKKISTTVQLENLLLNMCMDFDRANQPNAIDIFIGVFDTRKNRWRDVNLNAKVSDHGEIVARATAPFTMGPRRTGVSVAPDQTVSG